MNPLSELAASTKAIESLAETVRESSKSKVTQAPETGKRSRRKVEEEEEEPTEKRPLFSDLLGWLDGKLVQELPTIAPVTANRALFYKACVNEIHGEPGLGKSNILAAAAIAEVKAGGTVWNLDPEDTAAGFVQKLRSLSCDCPVVIKAIRDGRIKYIHNPEPDMLKDAIKLATTEKPTLVMLDGLAELMAQEDLNEDLAGDVLKFFRRRVRPFCEKAGSAVLVSDHVSKAGTGMYARGSGAKKGRYDGVSYELTLGKAYSPTVAGYVKLKVTKDRKGGVGPQGTHVVDLHLTPAEKGTDLKWVEPEFGETDNSAPLVEMEAAILDYLQSLPKKKDSMGNIRKAVKGRAQTIDQVGLGLVATGKLTLTQPSGNTKILAIPEIKQIDPKDFPAGGAPDTTLANPGRGKV